MYIDFPVSDMCEIGVSLSHDEYDKQATTAMSLTQIDFFNQTYALSHGALKRGQRVVDIIMAVEIIIYLSVFILLTFTLAEGSSVPLPSHLHACV